MTPTTRPLVLITGANQGIGLATAQSLARDHSYRVVIGARNTAAGEKVAADFRAAGHEATSLQLDLSSPTSIDAAVASIERDFGYLDVLINNAGVLLDQPGGLGPWDLYTKTFTPNVFGTGALTEGLLPLLRKARSGPPRIVFLSSAMGSLKYATDKTLPWYPVEYKVYDASKAAVNMLMLNYARVLDGVAKVNAVCPGLVRTNLTNYSEYGHGPEVGAVQVVRMATIGEDGPTATYTNMEKELPW